MTSKEYIKQKNKEMGISKYYTNKQVRERIDSYLKRNASIWANLGTKGKLDVGNKAQAKKESDVFTKRKIKFYKKLKDEVTKKDLDNYGKLVKDCNSKFYEKLKSKYYILVLIYGDI